MSRDRGGRLGPGWAALVLTLSVTGCVAIDGLGTAATIEAPRTTPGPAYLANLESQIEVLEARVVRGQSPLTDRPALASLLRTRGMVKGNLEDIDRAVLVMDEHLELFPTHAGGFLMRSGAQQTLHRFEAANRDVLRARELGASSAQLDSLSAELHWNAARYERAIAILRQRAEAAPGPRTLGRLAVMEHALGNFEASEEAFARALTAVVSTDPLPVAWLYVQWAITRMDVGNFTAAVPFLREAVERLPGYVLAEEHLAECLHEVGQSDEAIALYEKVRNQSSDPEFAGALANVLEDQGRTQEAEDLRQEATRGFEDQSERFEEALAFHSASFLEETGDVARARELLVRNLELRPNSQSFIRLAAIELSAGHVDASAAAVFEALRMPEASLDLYDTAAAAFGAQGQDGRAAEMTRLGHELRERAFEVHAPGHP